MACLPAIGKNHRIAEHYPHLTVASYDSARQELGLVYGENEGAVAHLIREVRQKALDLVYADYAKVRIIYLEQPESELYRRNSACDTSLRNIKSKACSTSGSFLFLQELTE